MRRPAFLFILFVWLVGFAPATAAPEEPSLPSAPLACHEGVQASGALYKICLPGLVNWNGELLVYAHGYVTADEPLALPGEADLIAQAANLQGLAFATTSYRTNGLAVVEGLADLVDLVGVFTAAHGAPSAVYLLGFSEGGLIATLALEQQPGLFAGGVAACAPIGNFQRQLNYITDFRLVFDYFFPGLMPGTGESVPPDLIANWDSHFTTSIEPVVMDVAQAGKVAQLMAVTDAPTDMARSRDTIYDTLRYHVIGTNDAVEKLGGLAFDNRARVYSGSEDDAALNKAIRRIQGEAAALAAVAPLETSGRLRRPLVTLHTRQDAIVPYWHESLYQAKVSHWLAVGYLDEIVVEAYGHCNFTAGQVLNALGVLQNRVANPVGVEIATVYLPVVLEP